MKTSILLFGVALGAAGCARAPVTANTFYKANMTSDQLSHDSYECESGARATVLSSGGDALSIYNGCMAGKGYSYGKPRVITTRSRAVPPDVAKRRAPLDDLGQVSDAADANAGCASCCHWQSRQSLRGRDKYRHHLRC